MSVYHNDIHFAGYVNQQVHIRVIVFTDPPLDLKICKFNMLYNVPNREGNFYI